MSEYPEHEKLQAVTGETQAAGAFLEWLPTQGVQLMIWREDLSDIRLVDEQCMRRRTDGPGHDPACAPQRPVDGDLYNDHGFAYWLGHCTHWEASDTGTCCRCGQGHYREVTGIHGWTPETRSVNQLLADWADIDQNKIEAEKRQMLAALRNGG